MTSKEWKEWEDTFARAWKNQKRCCFCRAKGMYHKGMEVFFSRSPEDYPYAKEVKLPYQTRWMCATCTLAVSGANSIIKEKSKK